jgi:hypothetical protein
MKIFKEIPREFLFAGVIALAISATSSFITYKILERKIPEIAVVDLAYLNNDFAMNMSRYLSEHHVSDEKIAELVKSFMTNLETVLKDINKSGNYVLLQKQTVVSEGVVDVTKDLEKMLFESVMYQAKQGDSNVEAE